MSSNTLILNSNLKNNISGFSVYFCKKHGVFFKSKKHDDKKCPYKKCDNKEIKKWYDI
jgi:hypothetical protein